MCGIARAIKGACLAIVSERSAWAWRVRAPISTAPLLTEMPSRPPMPLMSISKLGAERRILSVAMRLCPPAKIRASLSPRSVTASSSERAFLYANGAGFTRPPHFCCWHVILPENRFPLFGIARWLFSYCDRERREVNAGRVLAIGPLAAYKCRTKSGERPVPKEFEGKVVVVSGGSRGIGQAIAAAFGREGEHVVLAA